MLYLHNIYIMHLITYCVSIGGIQNMDNYTGPYRNDGKFQTSTEFAKSPPMDYVDQQSRLHDSVYAWTEDIKLRAAADMLYYDSLKHTPGSKAAMARNAVLYGNYAIRSIKSYWNSIVDSSWAGPFAPLIGLAKQEYSQLKNLEQMADNKYLVKEKQRILEYFKTDPHPEFQTMFDFTGAPSIGVMTPQQKQKNINTIQGQMQDFVINALMSSGQLEAALELQHKINTNTFGVQDRLLLTHDNFVDEGFMYDDVNWRRNYTKNFAVTNNKSKRIFSFKKRKRNKVYASK